MNTKYDPSATSENFYISALQVFEIIEKFCIETNLNDNHVQYALSKSGVLPPKNRTICLNSEIRKLIWRRKYFGSPARGKTGTVVRDKTRGSDSYAYLMKAGNPTYIFSHIGPGIRADFEVVTPRTPAADFIPDRLWLPYGYWTLEDGSEVIFSRDYCPMWEISGTTITRAEPGTFVKNIKREDHFFKLAGVSHWLATAAREAAITHLENRRIFELPVLVDLMPDMLAQCVTSVKDFVMKRHCELGLDRQVH